MRTTPPCGLGPGPVLRDPLCPKAPGDTPPPSQQGSACPGLREEATGKEKRERNDNSLSTYRVLGRPVVLPLLPGESYRTPPYSQKHPRSPKGTSVCGSVSMALQEPAFSWAVPGGTGMAVGGTWGPTETPGAWELASPPTPPLPWTTQPPKPPTCLPPLPLEEQAPRALQGRGAHGLQPTVICPSFSP